MAKFASVEASIAITFFITADGLQRHQPLYIPKRQKI